MIRTPTLFVLGAGASNPYGLPLGRDLRTLICDAEKDHNPTAAIVAREDIFTEREVREVARKFLRSNVDSIDNFLARQEHFAPVGKAIIAAIICSRENPDEIFSERDRDHWYRLLWNALIDGTKGEKDLSQNNIRFITFNYDRSLEFFLHESTKATYGANDAAAYIGWSSLPIVHAYGSVGEFDFTDGASMARTRPYIPEVLPGKLGAAAAGINIIPEGRENADVFQTAFEWFAWAQDVYILGFGFDRLNCERLGFIWLFRNRRESNLKIPKVIASVFGLTSAEVSRANNCLLGGLELWGTCNETCTMTLRMAGLPQ